MNIASLNKLEIISGQWQDMVSHYRVSIQEQAFPGLSEMAFYIPEDGSPFVYLLSFWTQLEALYRARQNVRTQPFASFETKVRLVEQLAFQQIYEYRLFSNSPQASYFRLLNLPPGYSREQLQDLTNHGRGLWGRFTGLCGLWFGSSVDGPPRLFSRSDWATRSDMLNYLQSPKLQSLLGRYETEGITTEYAVFSLQGLFRAGYSNYST